MSRRKAIDVSKAIEGAEMLVAEAAIKWREARLAIGDVSPADVRTNKTFAERLNDLAEAEDELSQFTSVLIKMRNVKG